MVNSNNNFKKVFSKEEVIKIAISLRGLELSKYKDNTVMIRDSSIEVKDSAERGRLRKLFEFFTDEGMPTELKQGKLIDLYRSLKNSDSEDVFRKRQDKFNKSYETEYRIQIGRRKLKEAALENDILKQLYNRDLPIYIDGLTFFLIMIVDDDMAVKLRKKVLNYKRLDIKTFEEVVEDLNILLPNLLRYLNDYGNNIKDTKKKELFIEELNKIDIGLIEDAIYTICDTDNKEAYEK